MRSEHAAYQELRARALDLPIYKIKAPTIIMQRDAWWKRALKCIYNWI